MHTLSQSDVEVQFFGSSSLPDIRIILLDYSSIHEDDTSSSEIGWNIELVGGSGLDWEDNLVVETDISVAGSSSTEFPV